MNYERSFSSADASPVDVYVDVNRPKKRRGPFIVGLLSIFAILGAAWFAFSKPKTGVSKPVSGQSAEAPKESKQDPNVSVIVPLRSNVPNFINANGTLAARRDMPIGVSGEGGMVTRVHVDAGQWVRAGQLLASVDRQVQSQALVQISAQIREAEANARLAQNEMNRSRALVSRGFVSKADLDRKTAQRDAAMARLGTIRAQFNVNSTQMRRLDIRAPSDGLILERKVEPGQVVGPGSGGLFRMAMNGSLEMRAQLGEADLAHMAIGYRALVTPVGSTQSFPGRVYQMPAIIDPQTKQGAVKIALPFSRALRPGGFASVRIDNGSIVAPLLPQSAVLSDTKGTYVYVVGPDNKVVRTDVKVGSANELGVTILSGLSGTEQVVERAGGFLSAGDRVVPKRVVAVAN